MCALVSSSRGVLYHYMNDEGYDQSARMYRDSVRARAVRMQEEVYSELKKACPDMEY